MYTPTGNGHNALNGSVRHVDSKHWSSAVLISRDDEAFTVIAPCFDVWPSIPILSQFTFTTGGYIDQG
jgi:hypothetical protein